MRINNSLITNWVIRTFIGIFLVISPNSVQAASATALSLAPHTFDLPGVAGEMIKKTVKIHNNGQVPIPLRFLVSDFDAEDGTGRMILPDNVDKEKNSFSSWIQLDKNEMILDPSQTAKVGFSIDIPVGTPDGGYYAIILVETDISSLNVNDTRTQILPSAGVIVMLSVGEEEPGDPVVVEKYQVLPESRITALEKPLNFLASPFLDSGSQITVVEEGRPDVELVLKNTSHHHIKLANEIKIIGLSEKEKDGIDLPDVTILPGKTRRLVWEKDASRKESPEEKRGFFQGALVGPAKARLVMQEEQGEKRYQDDRLIFIFPWKIFLALAIILLAGVLIYRQKKGRPALWITFSRQSWTRYDKNVKIRIGKILKNFLVKKKKIKKIIKINLIKKYGKKKNRRQ